MLTNKTHTSDSPSNLIRISWRAILLIATLLISSQSFAVQTITFYHNDVLGSPVAATDENGNICWREDYQPYGAKLENNDGHEPSTAGCGLDDNQRGYTGHVHDKDIGLTYMQARYYDPIVGRFMGVDPVGPVLSRPASFNRYAYADNNPINYIDPTGMATGTTGADEMADGSYSPPGPGSQVNRSFSSGFGGSGSWNNSNWDYQGIRETNWSDPDFLAEAFLMSLEIRHGGLTRQLPNIPNSVPKSVG